MRQWFASFFLSGRFAPWAIGLAILVVFALPDAISEFVLGNGFFIGTGAFLGWLAVRFLRDIGKWGLRRAFTSYFVIPALVTMIVFASGTLVTAMSWALGDADAFNLGRETLIEIAWFVVFLGQDPRIWSGLVLGGLIYWGAAYRRRQAQRGTHYLTAIQLLKQFLYYYLHGWRMRTTKELPFQHEWSASPDAVGQPTDDEVHPYLDLRPRNAIWLWLKGWFVGK